MPGQAVFIDLPKIDDLDSRERVLPIEAERVIVCQPRECITPPGGVAQPADDGREREDGGPSFQRRPLDAPDAMLGQSPSGQALINQMASGTARIAPGQSSWHDG